MTSSPTEKGAAIVRANALTLPFADASVDLIVTSPPYFALRSYSDGGEHYDGQIGSEEHPQQFLEALWAVMHDCWRVLKPQGVAWVNLGDKRAGSGGHNNDGVSAKSTLRGNGHVGGGPKLKATRRQAPDRYKQQHFGRKQTKQLLPARFAIGCMDGLADPEGIGWIVRQDEVWTKPNGMPDTSGSDRTQDRHEFWFHMTKQSPAFGDVDPIREPYAEHTRYCAEWEGDGYDRGRANGDRVDGGNPNVSLHPLGRVPYSWRQVNSEGFSAPSFIIVDSDGSLRGTWLDDPESARRWCQHTGWTTSTWPRQDEGHPMLRSAPDHFAAFPSAWPRWCISGWCPPDGIVLDPFGGTGTTAMVARALGRYGISVDLSADYLRLARWRIWESGQAAKVAAKSDRDRQGVLL